MPVCTKQNRIAGSALEMELSVAIISSLKGGVLTPPGILSVNRRI